ncbi:MAG: BlaI/MecI/CopY family transcriptional regulator [Planctomycetes bacterium]|nr:BlaI/MecI/CopY family transcriptional regulator [Planctomycetota bacterium]
MVDAAESPSLTDAEWTVMRAVWQGSPCTARDVLERVADSGWAYTTVRTLLQRLIDKGAVAMRLRGNTSIYEARLEQQQARQSAVRSLLQRAFDGSFGSLLAHLARTERLSARERARLQQLLDEQPEERS